MKRSWTALLLVALLLLSPCALAAYPEYLNLDSQRPMVKDGYDVTISLISVANDTAIPADQMYLWRYMEEVMNVKIDATHILTSARDERKNLLFASDDLPDLLFGMKLSQSELMMYGQNEKQLLALEPYINETLTPTMMAWQDKTRMLSYCTLPDGHIYSVPLLTSEIMVLQSGFTMQYNQRWFEEKGMAIPTTLEEYLEALRAFKAENAANIPLGGGKNSADLFLLTALGFVTTPSTTVIDPAFLRGEVVIPAADPLYLQCLKTLNQYYTEGLISAEYFTIDATAVKALAAEGKNLFYPSSIYTAGGTDYFDTDLFGHWWAIGPLTSEWNDVRQVGQRGIVSSVDGFAVSAKTQAAELIMRFADWTFTDEGSVYMWNGPVYGTPDALGLEVGYSVDPETLVRKIIHNGNGNNIAPQLCVGNRYGMLSHFGDFAFDTVATQYALAGLGELPRIYDMNYGSDQYTVALIDAFEGVGVPSYPSFIYFDEEDSIALSDIQLVLKAYVEAESAKFITGARSLDTFDSYLSDLKGLGVEEYLGYYQTAYENYLRSTAE